MNLTPINLQNKFSLFNKHWLPKVIAEMNEYPVDADSELTADDDVWI